MSIVFKHTLSGVQVNELTISETRQFWIRGVPAVAASEGTVRFRRLFCVKAVINTTIRYKGQLKMS